MATVPLAPVAKPSSLHCPHCGGPLDRRGYGYTLTMVCPQCLSVLDATTPKLTKLQQIEEKQRCTLAIPLGARGKFGTTTFENIGFQVRGVTVDGQTYSWHEYLLFNPYVGFRYLTTYNGHWNFVTPLESVPVRTAGARPTAVVEQRSYRHFSGGKAKTSFVLGEFPWRVKAGDTVWADDFVDPPEILSGESTNDEATWSKGSYILGTDVWKAFQLPGTPPPAIGTYLNQPNPYAGKPSHMWTTFLILLCLLLGLMAFFGIFSRKESVLAETHRFSSSDQGEASYVTRPFKLEGRTSTVELSVDTDLSNNWAYFNFALINQDTGVAYDFGREVSYYSGSDSDGAWTEGDRTTTVLVGSIPPGNYYLRVEPEMDSAPQVGFASQSSSLAYNLRLRHDVPYFAWFLVAGLLIFIPPLWTSIRSASFEAGRWKESDYAPNSSNDDDDD